MVQLAMARAPEIQEFSDLSCISYGTFGKPACMTCINQEEL
jgi:hypothetical protein